MNYVLAFLLLHPVATFIILCVILFVIPFIIGMHKRKKIINGINVMRDEIKNEIKDELKSEIKDEIKKE